MATYRVEPGPDFKRRARKLAKRYHSLAADVRGLVESLTLNPQQGTALGRDC